MTSTTELDSMEDDGGVMGEYYGEDREYSEEEGELFGEGEVPWSNLGLVQPSFSTRGFYRLMGQEMVSLHLPNIIFGHNHIVDHEHPSAAWSSRSRLFS